MKNKKLFLPTVIMIVALLAITAVCIVSGIALKPTVTEAEFPFSITYEYNGETVKIDDVYYAYHNTDYGYATSKERWYSGKIGTLPEGETLYTIKESENESIFLSPEFYADYMMGDPYYDYFDDEEFAPKILAYDYEGLESPSAAQKVKIIGWEYPAPIEKTSVFSHIANMDSEVVLPILIIGLLALLATLIFVKKDKDTVRNQVDTVSIVFNFIVGFAVLPFFTVCAWLLDALGSGDDIVSQIFFLLPVFTALGIAYSIALRRKGYSISGLLVQFTTSVIFGGLMFLHNIGILY